MIVYRITLAKYADQLLASGNPARWNSKDVKVIYTAASRALACLENVVHRSSRGLRGNFRTILIEIPDNLKITVVEKENLQPGWQNFINMPYTQRYGDHWVRSVTAAVLKVPSVIIPEEHNYILNPAHEDFIAIRHLGIEPFEFDTRLPGI